MGVERADHQSLGVATEGVLEQVGQLAFSEIYETRHEFAAFAALFGVLREVIDDFAKITETGVDLAELFQPLSTCVGVLDPLTACQIDDMKS